MLLGAVELGGEYVTKGPSGFQNTRYPSTLSTRVSLPSPRMSAPLIPNDKRSWRKVALEPYSQD